MLLFIVRHLYWLIFDLFKIFDTITVTETNLKKKKKQKKKSGLKWSFCT